MAVRFEKIGKHQLISKLGAGKNTTVFRAVDEFTRRDLAIKVFTNLFVDDDNFEKQLMAAVSTSKLINHPHIVSTYYAARELEYAYIEMELVQGKTLQLHAGLGKLFPVRALVQIMFKCCMALDHAYFKGVLHENIKPSNIMYTANGEIKISDFAAATISLPDTEKTAAMPSYVAPEVYAGGKPNVQSDIYSLGVVMYKLLTGKMPFTADEVSDYFYLATHHDFVDVTRLRPEVPARLAEIVHKAIDKNPARRYQTWVDIASDLAGCERAETTAKTINDSDKFYALKTIDFFEDFSESELWEVIRLSEWAEFAKGRTLVKEGDFGTSFFMIIKGQVQVGKAGKNLTTLEYGDCFGEMAYIDKKNAERTASVVAASPVMLMKVKSGLLEQAPAELQVRFTRAFLKVLVKRLAVANQTLAAKSQLG